MDRTFTSEPLVKLVNTGGLANAPTPGVTSKLSAGAVPDALLKACGPRQVSRGNIARS